MKSYPLAVMRTVWRRIKKPRKGSLIVIQGQRCKVIHGELTNINGWPVLTVIAEPMKKTL